MVECHPLKCATSSSINRKKAIKDPINGRHCQIDQDLESPSLDRSLYRSLALSAISGTLSILAAFHFVAASSSMCNDDDKLRSGRRDRSFKENSETLKSAHQCTETLPSELKGLLRRALKRALQPSCSLSPGPPYLSL
jgi:hypothetical protein